MFSDAVAIADCQRSMLRFMWCRWQGDVKILCSEFYVRWMFGDAQVKIFHGFCLFWHEKACKILSGNLAVHEYFLQAFEWNWLLLKKLFGNNFWSCSFETWELFLIISWPIGIFPYLHAFRLTKTSSSLFNHANKDSQLATCNLHAIKIELFSINPSREINLIYVHISGACNRATPSRTYSVNVNSGQ